MLVLAITTSMSRGSPKVLLSCLVDGAHHAADLEHLVSEAVLGTGRAPLLEDVAPPLGSLSASSRLGVS